MTYLMYTTPNSHIHLHTQTHIPSLIHTHTHKHTHIISTQGYSHTDKHVQTYIRHSSFCDFLRQFTGFIYCFYVKIFMFGTGPEYLCGLSYRSYPSIDFRLSQRNLFCHLLYILYLPFIFDERNEDITIIIIW